MPINVKKPIIKDIISPTKTVFTGDNFKNKNGNIIHDISGLQYPFIASIKSPCAYEFAMQI
jgi:mRNA-degrading endonuclease HigB of HigAB toxin-antitoxin module